MTREARAGLGWGPEAGSQAQLGGRTLLKDVQGWACLTGRRRCPGAGRALLATATPWPAFPQPWVTWLESEGHLLLSRSRPGYLRALVLFSEHPQNPQARGGVC